MKKTNFVVAMLMLFLMLMHPISVSAISKDAPIRVINLVYDDSGSMINTNNQNVDTWCQAKYAIEVFAAMLGENDTMNVYVMSDFNQSYSSPPKLVLNGVDGASTNVNKVHSMITRAGNTPFASVEKAYSDLKDVEANEKWLVVLTDGEFQGVDNIDDFFSRKENDIKVMFLGMGSQADGIVPNEAQDIYFAKAQTNSDILKKITDICTRIFNSDRLEVNTSSKSFSFDVPMGELVVFAQGANVQINGIKDGSGTLYKSSSVPVTVKYSEVPATNCDEFIVDRNLLGSIATFKDDFVCGDYTVDVSGAETIEIYYKPNVEIKAYLIDSTGNEVTEYDDLAAGEYIIEFGFVKGGTREKVAQSKLLGEVNYEAKVVNNGIPHDKTYQSGDKITLIEGDFSVDVTANYLDYNTVSSLLNYSVYKDKIIEFYVAENTDYIVTTNGFDKEDPIVIKATIDGNDFNDEQWNNMGIPVVEFVSTFDFKMGDFQIEKSDITGNYYLYPSLLNDKPSTGTYVDCVYSIKYEEKLGSETWSGTAEYSLQMQDNRSWMERNKDLFIKLIILSILLFLVIGYLPFVKHYLPKSLKKKPYIKCIPEELGAERKDRSGSVEKNLVSTIIPYIPQTGKIKYVPKGVTGAPTLEVKGIKNRRMSITNIKVFVGKEYITFDGTSIKKDCKRYETSAGVQIKVQKNGWTYQCNLNQASK